MKKIFLAVIAVMIMTSGCADLQELKSEVIQARKSGQVGWMKDYPISVNQAWDITTAVFRWEKTEELDANREENYVITSTGMNMVAFGSVMGVWIEPVDSNNTRISVITKRRVQGDIFTRLTEKTFFKKFEHGVVIVRSGGRLPFMLQ